MEELTFADVRRRRALILVVATGIVVFGFLVYKGWDKVVNGQIDEAVIVTGSFTCLPNKDETKPERGCVLGVRSRDGSFFALDISRIQDANTDLEADDTIAVTGTILPVSENSTSDWAPYEIKAVILVNTLLRTR